MQVSVRKNNNTSCEEQNPFQRFIVDFIKEHIENLRTNHRKIKTRIHPRTTTLDQHRSCFLPLSTFYANRLQRNSLP